MYTPPALHCIKCPSCSAQCNEHYANVNPAPCTCSGTALYMRNIQKKKSNSFQRCCKGLPATECRANEWSKAPAQKGAVAFEALSVMLHKHLLSCSRNCEGSERCMRHRAKHTRTATRCACPQSARKSARKSGSLIHMFIKHESTAVHTVLNSAFTAEHRTSIAPINKHEVVSLALLQCKATCHCHDKVHTQHQRCHDHRLKTDVLHASQLELRNCLQQVGPITQKQNVLTPEALRWQ